MNVSPVTAPAPAAAGIATARTESQAARTSDASRDSVRERSAATPSALASKQAEAFVEQAGDAEQADRQTVDQLKAYINDENMRLRTYHDEASGRSILEVRDKTTGHLVSQYPSEELIRLYASLRESLVDQSA